MEPTFVNDVLYTLRELVCGEQIPKKLLSFGGHVSADEQGRV
jgi:hypothetical protein